MKTFDLSVEVTQEHIDNSIPLNCSKCVVSTAILEALKKKFASRKKRLKVTTGLFASHVTVGEKLFSTIIPNEIQILIADFDDGFPIHPTFFKTTFKQSHDKVERKEHKFLFRE